MKKKIFSLMMVICMVAMLLVPTMALADAGTASEALETDVAAVEAAETGTDVVVSDTVIDAAIEVGVQIAITFAITLIGVFGAWLSAQLGKSQKFTSINKAQNELIYLAQQTVGELNQTIVNHLKAAHNDGKLTDSEIAGIKSDLIDKTLKKLSEPAKKLLQATAVDIEALIQGAAEELIGNQKDLASGGNLQHQRNHD